MARATSSLPVPDSPEIRTVLLVGAILAIRSKTSRMRGLSPIISSNRSFSFSSRFSARFSFSSLRFSIALRTTVFISSTSNGLMM